MREKRVMRIYHINYGQQEWGLWTIKNMIRGHWSRQGSLGWLSFKSNDIRGVAKKVGKWGTWVEVCQSVALPVMDYQGADAGYGWFELMTGNGWENMNGKNWWQGESAAIWAMTDKIRMGLVDDREELREGAPSISIRRWPAEPKAGLAVANDEYLPLFHLTVKTVMIMMIIGWLTGGRSLSILCLRSSGSQSCPASDWQDTWPFVGIWQMSIFGFYPHNVLNISDSSCNNNTPAAVSKMILKFIVIDSQ